MLYYHKCHDCLTAFSSTEKKIDECDCGGSVFFMGQVHGDRYVKVEDRPVCDGRCTHACGPSCDCACGGANHGSGKVVQTIVAEGKVKAQGLSEEDVERAQVYRKLRDYAYAMPLSWKDKRELDKIVELRVYKNRNEKLVQFITKHRTVG
jgi:hypothetical protein